MRRRAAVVGILLGLSAGCDGGSGGDAGPGGRDGGARDAGARRDAGVFVPPDPTSGCEGRLAPIEPAGRVETVGDGTAASCTEDALHAAVAALGAEPGGTLTFDCGGEPAVITLTRSVFVEASMTIDGEGAITLSGGGAVRVIELDHHRGSTRRSTS